MNIDITPQEELVPLTIIISALSILGSLFMMGCYIFSSELNKMPIFAFVANLALADFLLTLDGLPNLLYPATTLVDGTYCTILGGIRQFNYASSYLWAFTFGQMMWNFFKGEYKSHKDIQVNYSKIRWICWGFSFVAAAIPYFFNAYGPSLLFCWLSDSIEGLQYILLTGFLGYLPGFVLGILLFYYYISIIRTMKLKYADQDRPDVKEMMLYPIIFLVTIVFVVADRLLFQNYENNIIIVALHIILRQGQGFFNCIAYGMNSQVKKALKKSVNKDKSKNISLPRMNDLVGSLNRQSSLRSSLYSDYSN